MSTTFFVIAALIILAGSVYPVVGELTQSRVLAAYCSLFTVNLGIFILAVIEVIKGVS